MKPPFPLAGFLLSSLLTFSSSSAQAAQEPAVSEVLAVDTPGTTVDGNSFVAPAGWTLRRSGPVVVLTTPEDGSRIALIDAGPTKDADTAVAAAWLAYDAQAKRPIQRSSDRARRDGWDQIRSYAYDVPVGEGRRISAQALRHGDRWTVAIYDMANEVGAKRESQVDLVFQRLWPKGYQRESFAGKTAHKLDPSRVGTLVQFMEDARRQFDVPGVAIGIVQDGKVLFAGGLGVRELGKPEAVDADTLFMIASNNKALTTLLLAKEVDAGRFGWNTPVTGLLPSFRLGDADTTRKVLVKHLVCACTGLPRQDMETIFNSESMTPESIMATLATMQPTSGFGELYQYSNSMAAAAGFMGGHVLYPDMELGAAYDKAMQGQVFDPLGMTSTTFDFARALGGNHAAPHARDVDGRTARVDMDTLHRVVPSRPDGGSWSNVNDMLAYVRMELAKGRLPDGSRYIGQDALLARYAQQVATGGDSGYGMGLKIDRSWGIPVVNHGGSESGYRSDMVWLPEHGVGAVLLTNADSGVALRYPFRRRLVELLFDGKPEAAENVSVQAKRLNESVAVERSRLTVPADPVLAGRLARLYRNAALGDIKVLKDGGTVTLDFGGWKSDVATIDNRDGSFTVATISPGNGGYEFIAFDKRPGRSLVLDDDQHEYVFEEVH